MASHKESTLGSTYRVGSGVLLPKWVIETPSRQIEFTRMRKKTWLRLHGNYSGAEQVSFISAVSIHALETLPIATICMSRTTISMPGRSRIIEAPPLMIMIVSTSRLTCPGFPVPAVGPASAFIQIGSSSSGTVNPPSPVHGRCKTRSGNSFAAPSIWKQIQ